MPLPMPNKGADFEQAPAGAHIAVCYRVVDLGTQDTTYMGQAKRQHLILISWELANERMSDGRPFSVSKRYTYSSSPKANLRKDLESWRGRPFEDWEFGEFDIGKLLGAGCMLNVVHEQKGENVYTNIAAIMRLPKGTPAPHPTNPMLCFSLFDRPFDYQGFGTLSERLQEVIKRAPEYQAAIDGRDPRDEPPVASEDAYGAGRPDLDDEIPF